MARIYTLKRFELKEIGNLLNSLPQSDHSKIKAQQLAKIKIANDRFIHVPQDGIPYDIWIQELSYESQFGRLKVVVKAWKNGKELILDNPLYFANPPIMVHDGTFHKYRDSITGKEMDRHNYVEDLEQALKEMVTDTIRITGK